MARIMTTPSEAASMLLIVLITYLSPSLKFLRSFSIFVLQRFVFPPFRRYPPQTMVAAALP